MSLLSPSNAYEEYASLSLPDIIWCKTKDLFRNDQKNVHRVLLWQKKTAVAKPFYHDFLITFKKNSHVMKLNAYEKEYLLRFLKIIREINI